MASFANKLELSVGDYDVCISPEIGRGSYGNVYKAIHRETKETCAVKKIELTSDSSKSKRILEIAKTEETILKKLKHENIVQYFGVYPHISSWWIFLQYCNEGNLKDYIKKGKYLSQLEKIDAELQCARAVEYIHKNRVIHRDIKLANYLVTKAQDKYVVKLTDFGLSKLLEDHSSECMMTNVGTRCYRAPELFRGEKYTDAVDIFSLGLVICVIFKYGPDHFYDRPVSVGVLQHGKELCIGEEMLHREVHLVKITLDDTPKSPQRQMKEIIMGMIRLEPGNRMSITDVCSKLEDIIQQLQGTKRSKANPADVSVSTNDDSSSFLKTSEDCTSDFLKGIASNSYQVQKEGKVHLRDENKQHTISPHDTAAVYTDNLTLSDLKLPNEKQGRQESGVAAGFRYAVNESDDHIKQSSNTKNMVIPSSDDDKSSTNEQSGALANDQNANTLHTNQPKSNAKLYHEPNIASSKNDIAVVMAQAIIHGNENLVSNYITYINIEGRINDWIPKELLKGHMLADDIEWTSVIDLACRCSSLETSRELVLAGASVHNVNSRGDSTLHSIVWSQTEQMEKFGFLVEFNKDLVNYSNDKLESCLHYSAHTNDMAMCNALLKHGADIHARDNQGATCFHHAAIGNSVGVMDLLMEHGADLDAFSDKGTHPIHSAAHYGATDAVVYLLEKGVDIDCPTGDDIKGGPLHYAAYGGQAECTKELLKRGANVKLQNKYGRLPVHYTAQYGQLDVVKILAHHDPQTLDLKDQDGATAYDKAIRHNYTHVAEFLREFKEGTVLVHSIRQKMPWFVSNIEDPMSHLDFLLSKQKLTSFEYRSIQSKPNKKDKIREMMLTLLDKKDPLWSFTFLESLRASEPNVADGFLGTPRKKNVFERLFRKS